MDNGFHITNREIFDAVQEVSRKLDEHLTEHRVRVEVKDDRAITRRYRFTIWVAIFGVFATAVTGLVVHV